MPIINDERANTTWQKDREIEISKIRNLIKEQIKSIEIEKDSTIVNLIDGRKYYWQENLYYNLATLLTVGEWETEDTYIFEKLISKNDIVIDVGANFGWYSVIASKLVGNKGEIHAFEPFLGTCKELQSNIKLNNLSNVRVSNLAVSDYCGDGILFYPTGSGSMLSSLRQIPDVTEKFQTFDCKVITLNEYVQRNDIQRVDFIKIDAEGAELPVLKGATLLLENPKKPILFIECVEKFANAFNYSLNDLYNFLDNYKYSFFVFDNKQFVKVSTFENLPTYNVFCIPEDCEKFNVFYNI